MQVREFVEAQDVELDIEIDEDVPELAMSLAYLNEHGGRLDDVTEAAKRSTGSPRWSATSASPAC